MTTQTITLAARVEPDRITPIAKRRHRGGPLPTWTDPDDRRWHSLEQRLLGLQTKCELQRRRIDALETEAADREQRLARLEVRLAAGAAAHRGGRS